MPTHILQGLSDMPVKVKYWSGQFEQEKEERGRWMLGANAYETENKTRQEAAGKVDVSERNYSVFNGF